MLRLNLFVISMVLGMLLLYGCSQDQGAPESLATISEDSPNIAGKEAYLTSPYVTAGDRVYMVGHQDGSFPELGWHIKGEMGGIWNHPIKLMDGFEVIIVIEGREIILDKADSFINYPYANKHVYNLEAEKLTINRWQFVPDGLEGIFIQFEIENKASKTQDIEMIVRAYSDLSPTWLGERTNMLDGQDRATFLEEASFWVVEDAQSPWSTLIGSNLKANQHSQIKSPYKGKGTGVQLNYELKLPANGTTLHNMGVSGSYLAKEAAHSSLYNMLEYWERMVTSKKERYKTLANQSKLSIPDKNMQQAFEWLKYNCDWLIRDVPEVGRGITAGIPDYPWWFGVDSEYALKGYMTIGQTDIVYSTIALLDSVSKAVNGNGRIIHEMSSNGAVFNPGNINETPQFASLIWEVYKWSGDKSFLEKYYPTINQGLDWLLAENDDNNNLFPDGFGMMEIHGMDSEMIDVAVYSQRGFKDAAAIANELGKVNQAADYNSIASKLAKKINDEFWSETYTSYADFIGTDAQALRLIEDAIVRADTLNKPWAVAELNATKQAILKDPSDSPRPWVLHHNWVVNTPMEMGIAPETYAKKALKTAEQFVNPFGVFVTGIDRDESAGTDNGSFKGSKQFSYTGAVMTLPTSVQAIAENNYGNPNKALNYLERMTRSFSYAFPGSIYEVSPDYGMITQAWNIYGYGVPIVQQFFGIQPKAQNKTVVIAPMMPDAWPEAKIENVIIGDNSVSMSYTKTENDITIDLDKTNSDWNFKFIPPMLKEANNKKITINGEPFNQGNNQDEFHENKLSIKISWE